jgi:(1->4)-alpha-D-glucan 1-alpha-D-glucosylmutase
VVDGLRIDHVDGLADPLGYLQRLRQAAGPDCYITVEKILAKGKLPADWPVSGTTGYEFIASLACWSTTITCRAGDSPRRNAGRDGRSPRALRDAKGLMTDRNFEGEFTTLLNLAEDLARTMALRYRRMISAMRCANCLLPFRSTAPTARRRVNAAGRYAVEPRCRQCERSGTALSLIVFIRPAICRSVPRFRHPVQDPFQQLTGPLMAKSVEDTLFFRHNLELALNEVGADPTPRAFPVRFHQEMRIRLARQPDALLGTSTHDTKRGEDARARLYTLTEAPSSGAKIWPAGGR